MLNWVKIGWILPLMLVLPAVSANVYQWIDRQGTVHFSDIYHPDAETVTVSEAQTYSLPVSELTAVEKASATGKPTYTVIIKQPGNETTIRNNHGTVAILVQVEPALLPGDKLQLILDETRFGMPQTKRSFQLNDVERGKHSLVMQVVAADNTVLQRSEPIAIYMFRPRITMRAVAK